MAVLSTTNVVKVFENGLSDRIVLYALRKISTGDTFDTSPDFLVARQAIAVGTTVVGQSAVVISGGTVVTMPAGLASDAGYLLVWGVSS
jgi:hypothetical protein